MSDLFRRWVRPRRRHVDEGAQMPLVEHLRELRDRMIVALLALVAGSIAAWFFYEQIFNVLSRPFMEVAEEASKRGLNVELTLTGVTDPFFIQIKTSIVAGIVMSSPVWLYQLWRFVTPALHNNERRWSLVFLVVAVPLFLAGVAVAYLVLPKGLGLLLGFTPQGVDNLITLSKYFSFVLQMILVFGIGFELPVFIVLLNQIGILPHARIAAWRRGFWFGILVFAAVATPTGDPVTMLLLGVPIIVLFEIAAFIALLTDRKRAHASDEPDYGTLGDDDTSPLDERPAR